MEMMVSKQGIVAQLGVLEHREWWGGVLPEAREVLGSLLYFYSCFLAVEPLVSSDKGIQMNTMWKTDQGRASLVKARVWIGGQLPPRRASGASSALLRFFRGP